MTVGLWAKADWTSAANVYGQAGPLRDSARIIRLYGAQ